MAKWSGVLLGAVAVDVKGNRSARAVRVSGTQWSVISCFLLQIRHLLRQMAVTLPLLPLKRDINGQPLVNEEIRFSSDSDVLSSQQVRTDEQGKLVTRLSSTTPRLLLVSAVDGGYHITHLGITFAGSLKSALTFSKTGAVANGRMLLAS